MGLSVLAGTLLFVLAAVSVMSVVRSYNVYWQTILAIALLGGVVSGLAGIVKLIGSDATAGAVLIVGSLLVLCIGAGIIQRATRPKDGNS